MGVVSTLLSAGSTAVSGFSIGTWLKMGAIVVVAVAVGGLYEYGQYEAGKVVALTQQTGAQQQVIADAQANVTALKQANDNWANAMHAYQKAAADQAAAAQQAHELQEKADEQLAAAEKLLHSNPQAATAALNALDDQLVGLLNRVTDSGASDGAAQAAAGTPGPAAPGAARP